MDSPLMLFSFRYSAGNAALNSGDNNGAVTAYKDAVAVWEKSDKGSIPGQMIAMCLTNLGTAYTRLRLIDEALSSFNRSIEVHPSFLMAIYNKAWLLENIKRVREAIEAWELYLRLAQTSREERDSFVEAQWHLDLLKAEVVLQKHGVPIIKTSQDMDSGEKPIQRQTWMNPQLETPKINLSDAEGHYKRGQSFQTDGNWDQAVHEYQEALKINPNYGNAHLALGNAHRFIGNPNEAKIEYDKAVKSFQEAVEIKPNDIKVHNFLAFAYQAQGRLDEAVKEWQNSLKIDPKFSEAHFMLGCAYHTQGNENEAISEYKAVLKIDPDRKLPRYNLGISERNLVKTASSQYKNDGSGDASKKDAGSSSIERVRLFSEPPVWVTDLEYFTTGLPRDFIDTADKELNLNGELISYVKLHASVLAIENAKRINDSDRQSFFSQEVKSSIWNVYFGTGASGVRYSVLVEFKAREAGLSQEEESRRQIYEEYEKLLDKKLAEYYFDSLRNNKTPDTINVKNQAVSSASYKVMLKYRISTKEMTDIIIEGTDKWN